MVTSVVFYNVAVVILEFIAVSALWVWLLYQLAMLGKKFKRVNPAITQVLKQDPNEDLRKARGNLVNRCSDMLPVVGAIAALDVIFSRPTIIYFSLFPLLICLLAYYTATTGNLESFFFLAPRSEVMAHIPSDQMVNKDNESRKRLLRSFSDKYRLQIIGHINFVVAILTFIVGTVVSKSFNLTHQDLIFVMIHTLLLSYVIAFSSEVLFFRHRLKFPE